MSKRRVLALGVAAASLLAGCTSDGGAQAGAPMDCAALAGLALDGVRIDVAEEIRPDPLWSFPGGGGGGPPGMATGVSTPFCRVAGVAEPEIGFEVWLPEDWNGKIQNVGNGGYAGIFSYPAAAQALARGYATGTTDTGHKAEGGGFSATWAVGRPERVETFGHLALHRLTEISKSLVRARYGREQDYAYYAGCSTGGRQGLAEAQLYPEDYDGILAGAPANNLVRLETSMVYMSSRYPSGAPLPPPLLQLVSRAAVAQCDPQDGVTDGIVSHQEACDFDPASLVCEAGDAPDQCLTPDQAATARLMHGPRSTEAGLGLYPGRAWGTPFAGETGPPADPSQTLVALMDSDYEWSISTFDYDRDVPPLEAEFASLINTDPDLSDFAEAGGKLILYHGWNDPLTVPHNTLGYFNAVKAEVGEATVEDFARLYMLPGVSHCAGGVGPDTHDALALLEAWVERGEAPERLITSKLGPDRQPAMTRPACPYPQVAVYDGAGDPNDAGSFSCGAP